MLKHELACISRRVYCHWPLRMAPSRWSNNEADWQRPSQLTPHSHIAYLPDGPHRTLSTTDAMGHVTHLGGVRPDFSRGSHFPPPPPGIGSRRAQAFQRDAREMNSLRRHPSFNQAQRQQVRLHTFCQKCCRKGQLM